MKLINRQISLCVYVCVCTYLANEQFRVNFPSVTDWIKPSYCQWWGKEARMGWRNNIKFCINEAVKSNQKGLSLFAAAVVLRKAPTVDLPVVKFWAFSLGKYGDHKYPNLWGEPSRKVNYHSRVTDVQQGKTGSSKSTANSALTTYP